MKIEIELKEFWLDEEELESALKRHVVHEAVRTINASIKDRVEKHIDAEVKRQVEESMYKLINDHVSATMATCTVKVNAEDVTLEEYVKRRIQGKVSSYSSSIDDAVTKIGKNIGDEIKKRYDMLFASQIVQRMHENQLLKEDVAAKLLEPAQNQ